MHIDIDPTDIPLQPLPKKGTSFLKELIQFALIVIFVVLPIRFFVAQPFVVVGSSMEPTFLNKDYLIVDELTYRIKDPERGDVVVFEYQHPTEGEAQKYFIKRIIGLPGETIDIRDGNVKVINNKNPEGFVLNETYIARPPVNTQTTTLQPGQYFVMGDNRAVSFDSRSWGPLDEQAIVGRALIRVLPFNKAAFLPGSNAGHYDNETK